MCIEDSNSRVFQFQNERLHSLIEDNATDIKIKNLYLGDAKANSGRRQLRFSRNLLMKLLSTVNEPSIHGNRGNTLWDDNCITSHYLAHGNIQLPSLKFLEGNNIEFLQKVKSNFELVDTVCFHLKFFKFNIISGAASHFFNEATKILNCTLLCIQDGIFESDFHHSGLLLCLKSYRTVFEFLEISLLQIPVLREVEVIVNIVGKICQLLVSFYIDKSYSFESCSGKNDILLELLAVAKYFLSLFSNSCETLKSWRICCADLDYYEKVLKGCVLDDAFVEKTRSTLLLSMLLHVSRRHDRMFFITGDAGKIGFFTTSKEVRHSMKSNFQHMMIFLIHIISNGIVSLALLDVLDNVRQHSAFMWRDHEIQALYLKSLVTCILCFIRLTYQNNDEMNECETKLSCLIENSLDHICDILKSHLQSPFVACFGLLFFRLYTNYFCGNLELEGFLSKEFIEINEDGIKLAHMDIGDESVRSNLNNNESSSLGIASPKNICLADDQEKVVAEMVEWKFLLESRLFRSELDNNASKEVHKVINTFPDILRNIASANTGFSQVIEQVLLSAYQIANRSIVGKLAMIEIGLSEYVNIVKSNSRRRIINEGAPFEQYIVALCEILEKSLFSGL